MSALLPTPAPTESWTWPAEVLDFAAKKHVTHILEPLRQAGLRLFPTGRLEVYLYQDHEIADWVTLVFAMYVANAHSPETNASRHEWFEELWRLDPIPRSNCLAVSVRSER